MNIITNVPNTYEQAINSEDNNEWKLTIKEELSNKYNNNVIEVVNKILKNVHIIDTKCVFTEKDNSKKKARLVSLGFQQIPGQDFIETYSPTIQADSLRLTVAIATLNEWRIKQLDIKAAYLNADLEEKIYLKIPLGDKN